MQDEVNRLPRLKLPSVKPPANVKQNLQAAFSALVRGYPDPGHGMVLAPVKGGGREGLQTNVAVMPQNMNFLLLVWLWLLPTHWLTKSNLKKLWGQQGELCHGRGTLPGGSETCCKQLNVAHVA
jgi:hypothetical protein